MVAAANLGSSPPWEELILDAILEIISQIFGPLLGDLIDHKVTGKKIEWGRIFRLISVGFLGFSVLMGIFSYYTDRENILGGILCTAPFFIIGLTFLVIEIIRKNHE